MAARTVPSMPSWASGQRVLASQLQAITTYSQFWSSPPMFRMRQTVAQSIPNATNTVVTMDTSEYDSDSGRAAGTPWAYTIPVGMGGRWTFIVHIPLAAAAANERDVFLWKNGAAVVGSQETMNVATLTSETAKLTTLCAAGDVMAATSFQQTGGAVNTFCGTNIMPTFEGRLISFASP